MAGSRHPEQDHRQYRWSGVEAGRGVEIRASHGCASEIVK